MSRPVNINPDKPIKKKINHHCLLNSLRKNLLIGIHKTTPKAKITNKTMNRIISNVPIPIPGPIYSVII